MSEPVAKRGGLLAGLFGRNRPAPEQPEPEQSEKDSLTDTLPGPADGPEPVDDTDQVTSAAVSADPSAASSPDSDSQPDTKGKTWFQRLTSGLTKTSSRLSDGIASVFTKRKLDDDTLEELEDLLIQADLGVDTAMRITETLAKGRYDKMIAPEDVRAVLADEVARVLDPVAQPLVVPQGSGPHVIVMVGVES